MAGKRTFIVDAGEGSNSNLLLAKIPSKPDALLLTHFHSDHIASLGDIARGHWGRNKATEPLLVIGTPGGDTGYTESIVRNAAGVDILFCEALSLPMVAVIKRYSWNPSSAKIARDFPDYHSSPEDAAKMAAGAGAGMLALYHIIPPISSALLYPVFLGDAGRYHGRQITLGIDGMGFNLPPDSETVRQGSRL